MDSVRRPAVAGTFYRGDPRALRVEIEDCFTHELGPGAVPVVDPDGPHRIRGVVCPHAGFQYSGAAAAWSYSDLARDGRPDVVVLLGPNHTGLGQAIAVSSAGAWNTPLGDVPVDAALRARLLASVPGAKADDSAHRFEHSLEVQLPFLQYLFGRQVTILPITLRSVSASAAACAETLRLGALAQALAEALHDRRALIIASNDMTHFEAHDVAAEKDHAVLEKALALDAAQMLRTVDARQVSMCGVLAVATMIQAAALMGAREGRLLKYYTSGDITGDKREVVGYAALRFAAPAP
jgi:hypothetical protein